MAETTFSASDLVSEDGISSGSTVLSLRTTLASETTPLAIRFRALFSLKHLACQQSTAIPAIEAIASAFVSPSALLKHELAYCLGQTRNLAAIPFLRAVLKDEDEDAMCRHEAAEAIGALGDINSLDLLKSMRDATNEVQVVRETCEIAVARIEWESSKAKDDEEIRASDFNSIDPAPPVPETNKASVGDLERTLLDTKLRLFERYRAMFSLRDLASPPDLPTAKPAVEALSNGFSDPSALFRHEIAFVFGQLSHPASIPALTKVLHNTQEASMVRHEAAEALGSLGSEEGVEDTLRQFLNDKEQVVRESVVVALDMADFEKGGETEYALIPETAKAVVV